MAMRIVLLAAVALTGCATQTMTANDCRGTNWYARGEQEAIMGMRPQIDLYTEQCSRVGAVASEKEYLDGWAYGYGEWTRRMSGGRRG
jgi:hypothetical protein